MKRADATTVAPESLSSYIQARFDEFSRSQKDVAQYIVDHLDDVAFQTAEELARRANTSSSTVVRFSQALGFEGYPELQHSAREEYRRRHAPGPKDGAPAAAPLFALDQIGIWSSSTSESAAESWLMVGIRGFGFARFCASPEDPAMKNPLKPTEKRTTGGGERGL